uniref:Uncharacterized protein n=1 Tax=Theileria parva TaxID=5875 RepID=Q4N8S9_THEPA|eukprot:XP_765912.1 hypothetical protein [Theileria parva strain Muguga]
MINTSFSTDRTLVFYKFIRFSYLKSSSDSICLDSLNHNSIYPDLNQRDYFFNSDSFVNSSDSFNSDFMCTLLCSKNSVSPLDVLRHLSMYYGFNPKSFQHFRVFVLVPLTQYFPSLHNLTHLDKLSASSHTSKNNNSKVSDKFSNDDGKNINFDTITSPKDPINDKLVWVSANLNNSLYTLNGTVHLKIYLPDLNALNLIKPVDIIHDSSFNFDFKKSSETNKNETKIKSSYEEHKEPVSSLVREEIIQKVGKWSHTADGKLKDIRTLLSTIQNVLWEDVECESMPLSFLVSDKDSIKSYYKFPLYT